MKPGGSVSVVSHQWTRLHEMWREPGDGEAWRKCVSCVTPMDKTEMWREPGDGEAWRKCVSCVTPMDKTA